MTNPKNIRRNNGPSSAARHRKDTRAARSLLGKNAPEAISPTTQPLSTEPAPDWIDDTPALEYSLELFTPDGGTDPTIDLTREEYIALKLHLAKLRGYPTPAIIAP